MRVAIASTLSRAARRLIILVGDLVADDQLGLRDHDPGDTGPDDLSRGGRRSALRPARSAATPTCPFGSYARSLERSASRTAAGTRRRVSGAVRSRAGTNRRCHLGPWPRRAGYWGTSGSPPQAVTGRISDAGPDARAGSSRARRRDRDRAGRRLRDRVELVPEQLGVLVSDRLSIPTLGAGRLALRDRERRHPAVCSRAASRPTVRGRARRHPSGGRSVLRAFPSEAQATGMKPNCSSPN